MDIAFFGGLALLLVVAFVIGEVLKDAVWGAGAERTRWAEVDEILAYLRQLGFDAELAAEGFEDRADRDKGLAAGSIAVANNPIGLIVVVSSYEAGTDSQFGHEWFSRTCRVSDDRLGATHEATTLVCGDALDSSRSKTYVWRGDDLTLGLLERVQGDPQLAPSIVRRMEVRAHLGHWTIKDGDWTHPRDIPIAERWALYQRIAHHLLAVSLAGNVATSE